VVTSRIALQTPSQSPRTVHTPQGFLFLLYDNLSEKVPHFTIMPPDDPIYSEVEAFGLVKLEQFGHQFDKTGFRLVLCGHIISFIQNEYSWEMGSSLQFLLYHVFISERTFFIECDLKVRLVLRKYPSIYSA
jgi:hypothetical protein